MREKVPLLLFSSFATSGLRLLCENYQLLKIHGLTDVRDEADIKRTNWKRKHRYILTRRRVREMGAQPCVKNATNRSKVSSNDSCLNYYAWLPGSAATFDKWAEFGGDEWMWKNVRVYLQGE